MHQTYLYPQAREALPLYKSPVNIPKAPVKTPMVPKHNPLELRIIKLNNLEKARAVKAEKAAKAPKAPKAAKTRAPNNGRSYWDMGIGRLQEAERKAVARGDGASASTIKNVIRAKHDKQACLNTFKVRRTLAII